MRVDNLWCRGRYVVLLRRRCGLLHWYMGRCDRLCGLRKFERMSVGERIPSVVDVGLRESMVANGGREIVFTVILVVVYEELTAFIAAEV